MRIPLAATSIALAPVMIVLIVLMPSAASAQRQPFAEHLITFRSLLFGPYGDEGPRASQEIDRLSAALSAWDSDSRRPARRIPSSNFSVPRKFTVSFGPGRDPERRSIDSINRTKRSRSFCAS